MTRCYYVFNRKSSKQLFDQVLKKTYGWIMESDPTDSQFYAIIKKVNYTTPQNLRQVANKSDLYFNKVLEKCIHSTKSDIFEIMVSHTKKRLTPSSCTFFVIKTRLNYMTVQLLVPVALKARGSSIKKLTTRSLGVLLENGHAKLIPEGIPLVNIAEGEFNKPYVKVENPECFVCMIEKDETCLEKKRKNGCPCGKCPRRFDIHSIRYHTRWNPTRRTKGILSRT